MRSLLIALFAITLVAACKTKPAPPRVVDTTIAPRLCDVLHKTPSQRMAECCASPPSSLLADSCTKALSSALASESIAIDRNKVDACAAAMDASLRGCDWVTPSLPPLPLACRGLVEGRLDVGSICSSDLECKTGLHCGSEGRCIAAEAIGSTCGRSVDNLAALARQSDAERTHPICAEHCSLVTHKCTAMPSEGTKCFADVGCADGMHCASGRCAAGKAQKPLTATGEKCLTDFDCAVGGCTKGKEGRVCGMTCSHAADLETIREVLSKPGAIGKL